MKIITFVFVLVFFNTAFAQDIDTDETFDLKGNINAKTGLIWLRYLNKEGNDILDSAYIKNGSFLFSGSVNNVARATLRFQKNHLG